MAADFELWLKMGMEATYELICFFLPLNKFFKVPLKKNTKKHKVGIWSH